MHELWVCQNIIDIIKQAAAHKPGARVTRVRLEIGVLAAIDHASLTFCFSVAARDTVASDAVLEILTLPGVACCDSCGNVVNIVQYYDACDRCGSHALTVMQGEEMRVKSMEVA